MEHKRYLTAKEAAAMLGVKEATLYAYVSRGLIRSQALSEAPRQHLYLTEDVQKLAERKVQRRDPAKTARDALHWGTPMLDSALSLIVDNTLWYRGYDAAQLAQERTFEEVVALLWTGDLEARLFPGQMARAEIVQQVIGLSLPTLQSLQVAMALAAAADLRAYHLHPEAIIQTGVRILTLMAAVTTRRPTLAASMADSLAQAWSPVNTALFNAALILCADHEFNVSSFVARVVASAEATPYAVMLAGLAALSGFKHGGMTERAAALLREIATPAQASAVIAERMRRGEGLPGFGHRLYPDGDPRAITLLTLLAATHPPPAALQVIERVRQEARTITHSLPNIDFALAALEYALQLPAGAGLTLFALGRTAGWIGHALEQYQGGQLIRPRARYTGVPPRS